MPFQSWKDSGRLRSREASLPPSTYMALLRLRSVWALRASTKSWTEVGSEQWRNRMRPFMSSAMAAMACSGPLAGHICRASGPNEAEVLHHDVVAGQQVLPVVHAAVEHGGAGQAFFSGAGHEEGAVAAHDAAVVGAFAAAHVAGGGLTVLEVHAGVDGGGEIFADGPFAHGGHALSLPAGAEEPEVELFGIEAQHAYDDAAGEIVVSVRRVGKAGHVEAFFRAGPDDGAARKRERRLGFFRAEHGRKHEQKQSESYGSQGVHAPVVSHSLPMGKKNPARPPGRRGDCSVIPACCGATFCFGHRPQPRRKTIAFRALPRR